MGWVHAVLDVPATSHAESAEFWSQALGWRAGAAWSGHPELRSFEPPTGTAYVHLQEIDGPPRVHIDLETRDSRSLVRRAERLGATYVARHRRWQTLQSPGGLPFCVLGVANDDPPAPVTWGEDGHRTRLAQVCVDSPIEVHDREVAFWRELLRGRWVDSSAPEFAGKWHDDAGSPIQLLFQRLDEPTGPVRAHLDLGTDDLDAEVRRLVGVGAEDIGRGHGWHVLRDPAGLLFCATENSPDQLRRRDLG
ncbi:VOC family protein [Nocardioides sp.]|uniref:VOC family protein n=1 Tax=Nocardioides sp. TaxID=35761 RepID=UPI002ED4C500